MELGFVEAETASGVLGNTKPESRRSVHQATMNAKRPGEVLATGST